MMKKLLLIVVGLVVVVVVAALALPFLIPTETYKAQIESQVERVTGRALQIEGPLEFSLLPSVALRADNVRLANAPGAAEADMVRLKALEVELKVWPLLRGSLEVDRLVLVEPQIHLEVDQQGRPNWQLAEPASAGDGSQAASGGGSEAGSGSGGEAGGGGGTTLPISDIKLGEIRIENGTLTYQDARSGTSERVDAINLSVNLPDLASRLQADGALDYKGRTIELDLALDHPLTVVQGGASPLSLAIDAELLKVGFKGEVSNAAEPSAVGGLDLAVSSIRDLAAWLAEPIAFQGEGLQKLTIKGQLDGAPSRVAFTDATIGLDAIEGRGELIAELAGAVPKLSGRLDLGAVDLDPYLAPEAAPTEGRRPAADGGQAGTGTGGQAGTGSAGQAPPAETPAPAAAGWSDEPIELPPLGGAEVDFELTLDALTMRGLELGPTVLGLTMQGNTLEAALKEFALYGGRGSGTLRVALEQGVPTIRQQFRLEGLQALPFLRAAADFERLEGTANAELSLTTRGNTERKLVQNLNGTGEVAFRDGALVGINLAAMVRNAAGAFLDPAAGEARKTDFAELGGTFKITDGVLANDDMHLRAPALRIDGSGRVNLPKRTINYRFEPTAAATLEGQGGQRNVAGLLVPVIVKGPWDNLTYTPDFTDIARRALEDPEALKEQIEQLGDQAGGFKDALKKMQKQGGSDALVEGLGRVLGGQPAPAAQQGEKAKKAKPEEQVEQLLKGLLGN
jgi:AsmA protein